ncbi:hypothetical protein MY10362_005412 [Beauveria mimosiformis]
MRQNDASFGSLIAPISKAVAIEGREKRSTIGDGPTGLHALFNKSQHALWKYEAVTTINIFLAHNWYV